MLILTFVIGIAMNRAHASPVPPCALLLDSQAVTAFLEEKLRIDSAEVSNSVRRVGEVATRSEWEKGTLDAAVMITFPSLPPRVLISSGEALREAPAPAMGEKSIFFHWETGATGIGLATRQDGGGWDLLGSASRGEVAPKIVGVIITLIPDLSEAAAQQFADGVEALAISSGGGNLKFKPERRLITTQIDRALIYALEQSPKVLSVHEDVQMHPFADPARS